MAADGSTCLGAGDWQRLAPFRILSVDIECAGRKVKAAMVGCPPCEHHRKLLHSMPAGSTTAESDIIAMLMQCKHPA